MSTPRYIWTLLYDTTIKGMKYAFTLISILLFISCEKAEVIPSVDSELKPYFDSFEAEAFLRGLEIDLTAMGLSGRLTDIENENVAGSCRIGNNVHEIIIDSDIWNRANRWTKELIIYHELGHCVLEREHENAKDDQGICESIMHESNLACDIHYNSTTRSDYLEELFSCCL